MDHERRSVHSQEKALSQLVDRACRHWEARRQAAARRHSSRPHSAGFTVALSREVGTQGTLIAHEVGRLLNWPVYDHELLERIAQDMGLRTSLLESVDEQQQSLLLVMAEAFLSAPGGSVWEPLVTESGYVHHLVKVVLALGVHGECVIVGRGAPFILRPETTLRVRLVGRLRERIAVRSRQHGIPESEAARHVRTIDRERTDFVQDHFSQDATDPLNYDLVLNGPRLTVRHNAELIVEALRRRQAQATEAKSARPPAKVPLSKGHVR